MREREIVHERRQRPFFLRLEEEVHVVRHEDKVVEADGVSFLETLDELEVLLPIIRGSEDRLTAIPTVDDVEEDVRSVEPRLSGHSPLVYHGT